MSLIWLYAASALAFLAIDALFLTFVMRPLFERHIGGMLREQMNVAAAAVFYLFYVGGVLWFATLPALDKSAPLAALGNGMLLGLLAYGTYEATNMATLKGWSWQMVATDMTWGAVLTGTVALIGYHVAPLVGFARAV